MALSTATISYDVSDQVGTDFDIRRTKIWVSTNIADGTVIDTVGNAIRVDTGQGTFAADGTGSVVVWTPGTGSNPDSWQTYVHLDYASPMDRTRKRRTFGPFTVTTSANLADLVEEQEVPAEYLTTITAALQVLVDDAEASEAAAEAAETAAEAAQAAAEAARDDAIDISGIATPDAVIAAALNNGASLTRVASDALYPRVFTPQAYGAVGDYNQNTNTGTDDTAAIQAAFDAAVAVGGTVHFPAKHYRVTDTIDVNGAYGLHVTGARSGIGSGLTQMTGAWLHYTAGVNDTPILRLEGTPNVLVENLGFHGRSSGNGLLVVSDNTPSLSNLTFRNLLMFRVRTGVYLNDSGGTTQSDQMLFESIRMAEVVNYAFRTNSANVTGIRFLRCTTAMTSSADDVIHYYFQRGAALVLESCFGGYGHDFVRIVGVNTHTVTLGNSQTEGSTNANAAFVRIGATGDAGFLEDTTIVRNCVVDEPIVLAGPSRKLLTQGNLWHAGTNVNMSGANTRHTSIGENLPASTVTGTNAISKRIDGDLVEGGGTPTTTAGANGSTSISVVGNTYAGKVTFTTAAGLAADTYAVVVLPAAQIGTGYNVQLTPGNPAAANALAYTDGLLSSQWSLNLHVPPAGATPMIFYYRIG